MALKYELEQWGAAVEAYDAQNYNESLRIFDTIAESAKFHFNMGLIYATIGEHESACLSFGQAVNCDRYFAVAYFQKGVSHFLLSQFDIALQCFDDALRHLRGNILIDYEQLGLNFRLYSCEVLFNRGLCYLYFEQTENGMRDLYAAAKEKETEEHNVIDEAIATGGRELTVFSIPVGIIYRPSEGKLKNVKTKDYLGKAKLVAAVDPEDAFTGFTGAQKKQTAQSNTTTPIKQDKTDGKVDNVGGMGSFRPRSTSTDPRKPPFPTFNGNSGRNPSLRRNPSIPLPLERTAKNFPPYIQTERNPSPSPDANSYNPLSRSRRLEEPHRSNTIDSGRPSPKLPSGIQRQNSLRNVGNSESLKRENSLQSNKVPRRSNTQMRAQYLQKQIQVTQKNMSSSSISKDPVAEYSSQFYQQFPPPPTRQQFLPQSPPLLSPQQQKTPINTEEDRRIESFNQLYDFMLNNDDYYKADDGASYNSPILNDGDDNYLYEEEAQFEIVTPPQQQQQQHNNNNNNMQMPLSSTSSNSSYSSKQSQTQESSGPIEKLKIKCYYKDTRVILVPSSIKFKELLQRIQEKFSSSSPFRLKYKDDDGEMVMMTDHEDLEMAIELISGATGGIGRMEY
ncbi:11085_t:CDS:10 [Ambispora gerdemannii]|uniref:11085_t:CDS:1 n=1 Tax=Ambispora gerdemannii TaxID=144530 RepID=A0A9N8V126_9GLOM|nr:11085_t:CDS:10 [Ambispora gerdemannii]